MRLYIDCGYHYKVIWHKCCLLMDERFKISGQRHSCWVFQLFPLVSSLRPTSPKLYNSHQRNRDGFRIESQMFYKVLSKLVSRKVLSCSVQDKSQVFVSNLKVICKSFSSEYKSFNKTILQVKGLKLWRPTQVSSQLLLRQRSDEHTRLESNPNLCPEPSLRPSRIPVNAQNDFTPKKLSKYEVFPKTEVRRQRRQSRSSQAPSHICHHPSSAHNSMVLSLPAHHPAQFPVIISQRAEVIITGLRLCVWER